MVNKFTNLINLDIRTLIFSFIIIPSLMYLWSITKNHIKYATRYVADIFIYYFGRVLKPSLLGSLTLKRYCRNKLSEENRFLYVPSSLDIKLEIDTVFVSLNLDNHGTEKSSYNHTDILSTGNRIRVIGDPGSGKSSLVKRLFRDACRSALDKPSKARLPILIELRKLEIPNSIKENRLGEWFLNRIRSEIEKSSIYKMSDCFEAYLEESGLLILLDGLDEVSSGNYNRTRKAIDGLSEELSRASENNAVILTMRTQFHQQIKDTFYGNFGQAFFIKPFSPSDIYEFLTRWPFKDKSENDISRIYKELTDRPTLREMCSNPLVLSMYVAEDQTAGHVVAPESRTEFYKKVTDELIFKRRLRQKGETPAYAKLREQIERVLGKLAYEHVLDSEQPSNSLQWSEALRIVREVFRCKKSESESIFREIAKETGLVSEEQERETFRFIHLTFCEFLAAFEAVQGQENGWLTLIETHKSFQSHAQLRSRLKEVIPFACGLLTRVKRESAVTDVVSLADDGLIARSFLETKIYDHNCWPEFVESQKHILLNVPEENWDEQWLQDLYLFNVVIRDANQCARHMPSIRTEFGLDEFFQTLVRKHQKNLVKLLQAYAAQDAAAAFRVAEVGMRWEH